MRTNVPQNRFFEWFYENVTLPTCDNIWMKYNKTPSTELNGVELDVDLRFVLWGDSDIPYLQQMSAPERIKRCLQQGVSFGKFGAKITEGTQPLDLGPFFKTLRWCGKHMTSEGIEKPLTITIVNLFQQLRRDNVLLLPTVKENALKDLLITTPEMMTKAFGE